jgi:hypothetical protein
VYAITCITRGDIPELDGVQQPEVYTTLAAANNGAMEMMTRFAEIMNPLGDLDEWETHHKEHGNGLFYGELSRGPGGHLAAEIKVWKVGMVGGASKASKTT